jgi:hypothetical protein
MSASAANHLRSVSPPGRSDSRPPGPEGFRLAPSPRLAGFVEAAARTGLEAPDAVRLGLERALVLADAARLGFGVEAARGLLDRAAARVRPRQPLPAVQARYVRALTVPRPVPAVDVSDGLAVTVPDRLSIRAAGHVRPVDLHPAAVPEMVAWETAAALEGRTMGEWALAVLANARAAAS